MRTSLQAGFECSPKMTSENSATWSHHNSICNELAVNYYDEALW